MTLARSYKLAARLSLKQGDYQNAVEYGEKVLRLFPKTEGANIELGHCHKIMGDAQVLLGEVGKGTKSLRIASKIFTDTLGGSHIWTQIAKQALRKACKLESSSDSKLASPTQDPDSQDQKSPLLVSEDQLFRKVFGDVRNAHILMHFLNSVLELRGEKRITDINLINTHRPPLSRGSKEIVFDISCVDQNGTIYVVEMQRSFPGSVFEKRVSYYSARALTDQIRRGDGYDKLDNVVFLGLLDFTLIPDDPSCVSNHRICNVKTALPTFDTLSYSFVELPKFRKKLGDLETVRDKWIYFIKNCHDMKKLPRELSLDQIREVFDIFLDYNS